ncbi:MAG: hypothetical protein ETSY1_20460 [Candidatus Entotheonella factor]|uniref:Uncharacterized protein n=1 Tax=Entotheonella factor TaxID=1429438 RepID=W4LKZ3_ENTF1|nr:hypothetical protein [Candidatus Entotheonella palauensis]ETW98016.1 MAG: hypothetical protein ETSY1_20460 [Candidatus Entotheonella factor]
MAQNKTILVVGLVADDDESATFMHPKAFDDFESQTVYEVVIRLKTGRPLPDQLMTMVRTQDDLHKLVRAAQSRDVRLAVMTDLRTTDQPQSVEELLALLPEQTRDNRNKKWCQVPPDRFDS